MSTRSTHPFLLPPFFLVALYIGPRNPHTHNCSNFYCLNYMCDKLNVSSRVRELSTSKVGTLLRISGQVVRTHPVHPELTSGNFLCLECQTSIPDVEQQFKFTEPTVCKNPLCQNRRRFMLQVNSSRFVDFQKVRVQETQQELPRGSIPRRWVWLENVPYLIVYVHIWFSHVVSLPPPRLPKQ